MNVYELPKKPHVRDFYGISTEVTSHFVVVGGIYGLAGDYGVILAPCGCRLILTTTAEKNQNFYWYIYGPLHTAQVVVAEKCKAKLAPIFERLGWAQLCEPYYCFTPPSSKIDDSFNKILSKQMAIYDGTIFVPKYTIEKE